MEQVVNKQIDQTILDNSILIIGPMGAGKSTISKELSKATNIIYTKNMSLKEITNTILQVILKREEKQKKH